MLSTSWAPSGRARDVALIASVHVAGCLLVLALGFDHVSDDDYARVTIAQSFAHAPRLDPSGTSWLPFHFWALGSLLMAVGRSLAAARVASIVLASAAAALPYLALRTTGAPRGPSLLAVAFATLSPWSLWLGAATVPESFTASFTAAGAIALGSARSEASPAARVGFALGLLAACLSRYEAWPVAAVLALVLATRALRRPIYKRASTSPVAATASRRSTSARVVDLVLAGIVAAGPLAWMAWNAHAHGDAFHFFQRVARFKRALGEGSPDPLDALLLYPRLFITRRPDITLALVCTFAGAHSFVKSRAEVRSRWLVPLGCAAAQVAFLAYGNVRDGAPAHHAERALLGVFFLTAAFSASALANAAPAALAHARGRGAALGVAALLGSCWLGTSVLALRDVPSNSAADDRKAQLAEGIALRDSHADHLELTPCAYEHFALIAAFGAPERVTTNPHTSATITTSCPVVERR